MNLYNRDYMILTPEEEAEFESLKEQEVIKDLGDRKIKISLFHKYPKAARHYISLFPNNYLDILDIKDDVSLSKKIVDFEQLLNSEDVNERNILNYIKSNNAYFVLASLLHKYFQFGHHEAHIFPEFQLGISYKVDYLIIGRSSGGWEFVFVELEAPKGNITIIDGDIGQTITKGKRQLCDWQTWLEGNYSSLKETFNKSKRLDIALPDEFITMDTSRFHFVVIAGRRSNFREKTYQVRRKHFKQQNHLLLHYDNLLEAATDIIGKDTY